MCFCIPVFFFLYKGNDITRSVLASGGNNGFQKQRCDRSICVQCWSVYSKGSATFDSSRGSEVTQHCYAMQKPFDRQVLNLNYSVLKLNGHFFIAQQTL